LAFLPLASPLLAQPVARPGPVVTLPNGLRVLGYEDDSTNLVSVFLALQVSAEAEGPELHGARDLLQEAFRYALEKQVGASPEDLGLTAALLSRHGLDLGVEWDYLSVETLCPRSELRPLLTRLGQTLFRDPLTPEALAAARAQTARQWESTQANPLEATYYLFRQAMLGTDSAAQPIYPEPATVAGLTLPRLEEFRARWLVPATAVLVLAGPEQPEQLVAEAAATLGSGPRQPAPGGWPPPYPPPPSRVRVGENPRLRQGDVERASLIMGYRLPAPADPDYPAGLVLFEMLAGPQGALETNQALRAALIAGAWMRPDAAELPVQLFGPVPSAAPYLAVNAQMSPDAVGAVHQALADAFTGVRAQFSDPAALARARRRAQNALALAGLSPGDRARRLADWVLFARVGQDLRDLPARLEAVTPADLKRVADRCFSREYAGVQMPE
jgi:predicted Zn-dependent peptidase